MAGAPISCSRTHRTIFRSMDRYQARDGSAIANSPKAPEQVDRRVHSLSDGWLRPAGAGHSRDGAIHYVCMDWRHADELLRRRSRGLLRIEEHRGVGKEQRAASARSTVLSTSWYLSSSPAPSRHTNNVALGKHRTQSHQRLALTTVPAPSRARATTCSPCIRRPSRSSW